MNYLPFSEKNRFSMSYGWQFSTRADTLSTCAGRAALGGGGLQHPLQVGHAGGAAALHDTGLDGTWAWGQRDNMEQSSPVTASVLP